MTQRKHSYKNPLYNTWKDMRRRCQDPSRKDFQWYGAKGITVCLRWESFQLFLDDMLPTYFKGGTIERLDNNKGYYPENCVWKTLSEQQSHRANTPHVGKLEAIKNLRQQGLTQVAIGKCLGMHQGTVSWYLRKELVSEA